MAKLQFIRAQAGELTRRLKEPRRCMQVISGARQVGKTTLALQVAERNAWPYHFASADEPTLPADRAWIATQWEVARQLAQSSKRKAALLVLDEVQKIPQWAATVKGLWDSDTRKKRAVKVVLLGSAPLLAGRKRTETLAGRFETLHLPHWSFLEMRQSFGWDLQRYLFYGAYPGAAALIKEPSRWAHYIRHSLIETTLSREVFSLSRVDKPALLRQLLHVGCAYSGQILSYRKIAGQLQDSGNITTLAHYLDLLSGAGALAGLQKYAGGEVARRRSIPKLQVFNTALMTAQSGVSLKETFADRQLSGRLIESAVGAHLLNAASRGVCELFYWRGNNREVDFVLRRGKKLVAIEVKSGRMPTAFPGLHAFSQRFKTTKCLIVGKDGLPVEQFLSTPAESWLE